MGRRLRYVLAGGMVTAVSGAQATAFGGLSVTFVTSVAVCLASMWLGVGPTMCVTFGSAFAVLGLPVAESAPFPDLVALTTGLASALVVGGLFHSWRMRGIEHAMVEAVPEAVVVADTRGCCSDVNSAACRLLGLDRADLVGRRIADFVPNEDRRRLELTRRRLASGGFERGEWRLRRGDGTYVVVEVHARIQPDGRCQAIVRDLSSLQRERADQQRHLSALRDAVVERTQALDQSEAMVKGILQGAVDAVIAIDDSGTIHVANAAAERMFGYAAGELLGKSVRILMPASETVRHDAMLQRFFRTGERRVIGTGRDVTAQRRDGTEFPVHLSIGEVHANGRRIFAGFLRDLTAEKQREHEFLQSQKLEVVGRLVSGIAHDFNNLLMGIGACARATANSLPAGAVARNSLEEIVRAASHGSAMTRRLLSFSQRRVAARHPTEVDAVVRGSSTLWRALLGEEIELKLDLRAEGACVEADDVVLEQVLLNLLVNSRDAMAQGGHVSIATSLQGERVVIVVADDGCGMSEEVLAHAFEPFFTTKPENRGTGIGLATVRSIVQSLDGQIDCVSRPGAGTTMRIDLPRCAGSAEAVADSAARAPQNLQGRTVLLVEDDRLVRTMLQAHLEGCGCRVLAAEAPAAALTLAEGGPRPDALVTDVSLPGMDGGELARRLRAALPGLPVVFMSAHSADHLSECGRLQRDERLLEKPFEPETLEALLAELPARSTVGNEPTLKRA